CEYWYCTDENCDYAYLVENDRECMGPENDGICADCGQCVYHGDWYDEDGDGLCDTCNKCIYHSYVLMSTYEPTCGEVGRSEYQCSVCGYLLNKDYVLPTGEHDYVPFAQMSPTCNEQGYMIYECQLCEKHINRDFVPATGEHVDADNDYFCDNFCCDALMCTDHIDTDGDYHCNNCGMSLCGDNHAKDYTLYADDEYHWYVCTICGDKFNVTAHDADTIELSIADCETDGVCIHQCYDCGHEWTVTYEKLGHVDSDDEDYECDHCYSSMCEYDGEGHNYVMLNLGSQHCMDCTKCYSSYDYNSHTDSDSDGNCDECGGSMDYVEDGGEEECTHGDFSYISIDGTGHESVCGYCGEVTFELHNPDDEGMCNDCGDMVYMGD
ncbi:MAG: hypothetical protein J6R34_03940, partial [Clostridia bacterium]|nr:hypothetical protein [Clostridia bacterium]